MCSALCECTVDGGNEGDVWRRTGFSLSFGNGIGIMRFGASW